ncbi:MAG TPA: RNA methyltransferase [Candidatus Acidoferrales bacterium]
MAEHRTAHDAAEVITSRDNRWVKMFRAGLRGAEPAADQAIAVEGPKLIEDALRHGLEADALMVSESAERFMEPILRAASASEAGIARSRVFRTTDKIFEGLSGTEAPQGVAALFRQPAWDFEDLLRGSRTSAETNGNSGVAALVVVLAGVQDPGNVGTALRSAEAFGATGVVAARGTADPWSPKAVRASAGSALRLPVLRGIAVPVLLTQLRVSKIQVIAAGTESSAGGGRAGVAAAPDLRGACAIFIGSEGAGLPHEVETAADARMAIPMAKSVESLNAGVAASILLYEAARQRMKRA